MNECLICFEEMDASKDRLYECIHCFKHIHISCYNDWEKQQKKIQLSNHNMQLLYNNDYNNDNYNESLIQNIKISKPRKSCLHCQQETKFKKLNDSCLSKIKKLFKFTG